MRRFLKYVCVFFLSCALLIGASLWLYLHSLNLDEQAKANPLANQDALGFAATRTGNGRILAVVSSQAQLRDGKPSGFELTELSRAWWVFVGNGFEVDIASPKGGIAPMRKDDLIDADYAFLNDPSAIEQLQNTKRIIDVDANQYRAIYFVGGKSAMLDFYQNPDIQSLLSKAPPSIVIGAVCHGPAALLNARLADGELLLKNKTVTAFSNAEELFLMPDAKHKLGFLLQDELRIQANYQEGPMYLAHVVRDGNLITGQNPWSSWQVAEQMVQAMGYQPVSRTTTAEEVSVEIIKRYRTQGWSAAVAGLRSLPAADKKLIVLHAFVAAKQGEIAYAWGLARLAKH
jgi:putative intracellular protease/amidase